MLVFILFSPPLNPVVSADGCAFRYSSQLDAWMHLPQEKQMGFVNYENGYEKLLIVIDVKNSSLIGNKAVWIIPVPSNPDNVLLDVYNTIPRLKGTEINYAMRSSVTIPYLVLYSSQTYTFPINLLLQVFGSGMIGSSSSTGQYTVYESIEDMGLTAEKVGANDSKAFQEYLTSRNLSLPAETNITIDGYIGKDYCFIVSWISDIERFRESASLYTPQYEWNYYYSSNEYESDPYYMLGLAVSFPTERIYYPLKLTSAYGTTAVPILLQVIDGATLSEYPTISPNGYMSTTHCVQNQYIVPNNLTTFFSEQLQHAGSQNTAGLNVIQNIRYTEVTINAEARYYTDDVWMNSGMPATYITKAFIAENPVLVLLPVFLLLSCLASVIAGFIIYRRQHPALLKFMLLGLSNCLSVIGFFIISFVMKIDQTFVRTPTEKKSQSNPPVKRIVLGVAVTYLVILLIILFLTFPGLLQGSFNGLLASILYLIVFPSPVIATIALFIYGSFKDKQKTAFVILFSILVLLFLLISQNIILTSL
ncbi:MAG: hypothetical protein JXA00_04735 [Candidatus Thermoplasmatota archaeon]|nr:hypothetical protein [Candidatus Thermoplasmatota archaeon]